MKYIYLLIIPVCFILYSMNLRSAQGYFYYYGLSDPSYVYLINSISMAQLEGVGHVDHPGTPVQMAGAVVAKIFHAFGHEKDDLAEDVLYRPEAYINVIDNAFIFLNALGLYVMGLIIFGIGKDLIASLLFQLIPFVSINITGVYSQLKTENFAFFAMMLLIALLLRFTFTEDRSPKRILKYTIVTGILCGFILAVKISFLCLVMLPLILLPGLNRKMIFLLVIAGSFVVFIIPALANLDYFIGWIGKMIMHDDRYGRGDAGVIDTSSYFSNVMKIFYNERFFSLTYFLSVLVLIFQFVQRRKTKKANEKYSAEVKFLTAVFLAMSINVLLVAKHYSHRYMFPALILIVPAVYLIFTIVSKQYLNRIKINPKLVLGGILILTMLFGIYNSRKLLARTNNRSAESEKILNYIRSNYNDPNIILSSGTTNEYTGLIMTYFYAAKNSKEKYNRIINERFPEQVWYDSRANLIYSINPSFDINTFFIKGKKVLFQSTDEVTDDKLINMLRDKYALKNVKLTKAISTGNDEYLYELSYDNY
ncbi:MAG: hypothetical protein SGI89_03395 [bacterium]|nr:hypothetical protein [bacterium]